MDLLYKGNGVLGGLVWGSPEDTKEGNKTSNPYPPQGLL